MNYRLTIITKLLKRKSVIKGKLKYVNNLYLNMKMKKGKNHQKLEKFWQLKFLQTLLLVTMTDYFQEE